MNIFRIITLLGLSLTASLAAKPNIVLVMADDQGWGDVAYNGHPVLKTPHLDDLAAKGLRFDHFYAAAPVCSPTRGSVLTGRHPNRFGCYSWGRPIRPQELTIAERLKEAGYATGHFGKWHLGSVLKDSPVNPGASGFDSWLSAFNFYDNDPTLSDNGKAVALKGESSMVAADAAIEFMRKQVKNETPFLAVVWLGSPHDPHQAAAEDLALYAGQKNANWLGEITGLDRAMGKLRGSLREMAVAENTVFWYTSDNGGLMKASSGGREKKGSIYEGGLRVPAIIEWPERITAARVVKAPGNTADIYPTVMEIVGCEMEKQPILDGVSLLPVIDGKSDARGKAMGFWDFGAGGISTPSEKWMTEELAAQKAGKTYHDEARLMADAGKIETVYPKGEVRGHSAWLDWPWKLHQIGGGKKKNAETTFELYNLEADPMEATNIIADAPDRAEEMKKELRVWLDSVTDSMNGEDY